MARLQEEEKTKQREGEGIQVNRGGNEHGALRLGERKAGGVKKRP